MHGLLKDDEDYQRQRICDELNLCREMVFHEV